MHQKKYLSKMVESSQTKQPYIRDKFNKLISWYDEFTGMDEVRLAQKRVLEDEKKFREAQEQRRLVLKELTEIQAKLKDLYAELDSTNRGDDRYITLVTEEHKLLKEEKAISEKFAAAEKLERDHFAALSSSVKLSHEKERAQGNVQNPVNKVIDNLLNGAQDSKEQTGEFHGFMMIPKVQSDKSLDKEQSDLLPNFKYHTIDQTYSQDDNIHIALLNDDKSYINNVNEFEMDNLSRERYDNVSVLQNDHLGNEDSGDQDDLVTWNSSTFEENWWSVCQLPVFVVLFAVIGVLALTFVIILWLKSQMIQSEKNKKLVVLDGNQIQLSSSSCPCPSSSLPPEDRWICHTVINLKNSTDLSGPETVAAQPRGDGCIPKSLGGRVGEIEKKSETVRIKAKGLLERRGSSASLTIDLPQSSYDKKAEVVTPTRECMNEEFLLSAGNVLSRAQLKHCLNNVQSLHQEFWAIPPNHPEKSVVTGCGTKNRYQTILPNEKTRVKLSESEEHPLDAYINANYIRGYDGEEKAYIATQGPLPNTVQDLYKMAWNERSPIIVMITKLFEKTKVKCECYFPTEVNATATYGDYKVTAISVIKKEGFSVRELLIQNNCETRRILHYWYDSWPDHKTPQDPHSIVAMAAEIEKCRESFRNNNNDSHSDSSGPVIVHCSAGIGRTGCFIAISLAISQLIEEDKVDILGIVCQMRCDRGGMIQTAEQYEFVHKAIALFEDSLPESSGE